MTDELETQSVAQGYVRLSLWGGLIVGIGLMGPVGLMFGWEGALRLEVSATLGRNEVFDLFALGVLGEGFAWAAVFLIDLEEVFDTGWDVGEGDAFEDFAGDGLGVIDSAAEDDVVAFGFFAVVQLDRGAHEGDVADVVLGAGVVATGEVDVDGLVEFDF